VALDRVMAVDESPVRMLEKSELSRIRPFPAGEVFCQFSGQPITEIKDEPVTPENDGPTVVDAGGPIVLCSYEHIKKLRE
jgi:hypothetical protein